MTQPLIEQQVFRAIVNDDMALLQAALALNSKPHPLQRPRWQRSLALFLARRGPWLKFPWWHLRARPVPCRWNSLAHGAVLHASPAVLQTLIEAGAWTDVVDKQGQSALHLAAHLGKLPHFVTLANAGSALDLEDQQGRTPRDILAEFHPALFHAWQQNWVASFSGEKETNRGAPPEGGRPDSISGLPRASLDERFPGCQPARASWNNRARNLKTPETLEKALQPGLMAIATGQEPMAATQG
jgi:hypothetical protein